MANKIVAYFVILIFMLAYQARAAEEGQPAPEFEATLLTGETYKFEPKDKQVVVFHFWASWCDVCLTEMPALNEFYKKHHSEGLQVIAVNMDEPKNQSKARELMKNYSFPGTSAKDAKFKKYGRIWRLPMTFVIDRKGILQKDGWENPTPLVLKDFETTITPLLTNKPSTPAQPDPTPKAD